MMIAKAIGTFDRRTIEIIAMGGLLHDVGAVEIEKDIEELTGDLTADQWREIRQHPKRGLSMLEKVKCIPDEVRYIVYQHHESPGGTGYPNGIEDDAIYYPAKIVSVADAFSALITKRPFRPAYKVFDALGVLKGEGQKFDQEIVTVLIKILGAYSNSDGAYEIA